MSRDIEVLKEITFEDIGNAVREKYGICELARESYFRFLQECFAEGFFIYPTSIVTDDLIKTVASKREEWLTFLDGMGVIRTEGLKITAKDLEIKDYKGGVSITLRDSPFPFILSITKDGYLERHCGVDNSMGLKLNEHDQIRLEDERED